MSGPPSESGAGFQGGGPSRGELALLALALLVSGGLSLGMGQDLNFDLLGYHFYCGYAGVGGRFDQDIAPAGLQTYLNPLVDVLQYQGILHLSARGFGFLLGALHGLNFPLLYLIARRAWVGTASRGLWLYALLPAVVGSLVPNAVSLLGTTMGQNLVSIPALLALLLVLPREARPDLGAPTVPAPSLFWAGLLSGVATGLKLTMLGCHLSLLLALLFLAGGDRSLRGRLLLGARFGVGSLLGFLIVNGTWSAVLFARFGNPIFPFANQVFRSPFYPPASFPSRYTALTFADYWRPPLDIALGHMSRLQEIGARDASLLLLLLTLAVSLAAALVRWRENEQGWRMGFTSRLLVAYWLAGYVFWVAAFRYYRYLPPLDFLAPLVLCLLLGSLVPRRFLAPLLVAVCAGLAAYARTDNWGRGDWRENWLRLHLPSLASQPRSLVLLMGGPITFAIPSFPDDARFIHLTAMRTAGGTARFDELIRSAVAGHAGPLLALSTFRVDAGAQDPRHRRPRWVYDPEEDAGPLVAPLGLALTDDCDEVPTRRLRLYLCRLARVDGSR